MTTKERLVDALRFGPMAQVMRGWDEEQRMWLCGAIADDLLAVWTRAPCPLCSGGSSQETPSAEAVRDAR